MARLDLLQELRHRAKFDHALAASYEVGADFFEGYCLGRLDAFGHADNVVVFMDEANHDQLVLREGNNRIRKAGRRYHLSPVRCGGVFHPKLYLFATAKRGLLVVGSCNLTKAGFSSNAELARTFRFTLDEDEKHLDLFLDALEIFEAFSARWGTPQARAAVEAVGAECRWLRRFPSGEKRRPRLRTNLETPLWPQVLELVEGTVQRCDVVSPYFDARPAEILDAVLPGLGGAPLRIVTEKGRTTMTEHWLSDERLCDGPVTALFATISDDGDRQILHGKALALQADTGTTLAFGSANFTRPALLETADTGNCECLLVVPDAPRSLDVMTLFDPDGTREPATVANLGERRDTFPDGPAWAIRIVEVVLHASGEVRVVVADGLDDLALTLVVELPQQTPTRLPLTPRDDGAWAATASETVMAGCNAHAARAHVQVTRDGQKLRSNVLFVTNLVELQKTAEKRFRNRVRSALESAERFSAQLDRLLWENDAEQLQRFLELYDLRVAGRPRPRPERPVRPQGGRGEPSPRHYRERALTLHEAATDFVDRHLRRLQRHCKEEPTLEGIPSFMHVARAITRLCESQVDGMLRGLRGEVLRDVEDWKACRRFLEVYLERTRELMALVASKYLPGLRKEFGDTKLRAELRPDVGPLAETCTRMLKYRELLDATGVQIKPAYQRPRPAPLFRNDLLGDDRWPDWQREMAGALEVLRG